MERPFLSFGRGSTTQWFAYGAAAFAVIGVFASWGLDRASRSPRIGNVLALLTGSARPTETALDMTATGSIYQRNVRSVLLDPCAGQEKSASK